MERNKDLRRKIAGVEKAIEEHEGKIRREHSKTRPNEALIEHWQAETDALRSRLERSVRRLKREW